MATTRPKELILRAIADLHNENLGKSLSINYEVNTREFSHISEDIFDYPSVCITYNKGANNELITMTIGY